MTIHKHPTNLSWQINLRYKKLFDLNEHIKHAIGAEYPQGMSHGFPQDRLVNWVTGMSDTVRNDRMDKLNAWLRDVCASGVLMGRRDVSDAIFNALSVREHMKQQQQQSAPPSQAANTNTRKFANPFG